MRTIGINTPIFIKVDGIQDTKETCMLTASNRARGCMDTVNYLHGWSSPHYPVPAIPLAIDWVPPDCVEVSSFDYFYGNRLAKRQDWRVLYRIITE